MNELEVSNNQTPIEIALKIDESGHTTARALYEFLEMDKSNFKYQSKSKFKIRLILMEQWETYFLLWNGMQIEVL